MIKNKNMEAFSYPTLGRVVYANNKKDADDIIAWKKKAEPNKKKTSKKK